MRLMFLLTSLILIMVSCRDVFEKDISKEAPNIILPTPYQVVLINPVNFKWHALDGAKQYRLEIVSPSFDNISVFAFDTLVSDNQIVLPLDSMVYQMRLTAINEGYVSKTVGPIEFRVGSNFIGGGIVSLNSPNADYYMRSSQVGSFVWNPFFGASSYEFSLRQGASFADASLIHHMNGITSTSYSLPSLSALPEAIYVWGVKVFINNGIESNYSIRRFSIDNTAPVSPSGPFMPMNSTLNGVVQFSWNKGNDVGIIQSPVASIFEIASSDLFNTILYSESVSSHSTAVDISILSSGTYYWRVKNIDAAGNESNYSMTQQFFVN